MSNVKSSNFNTSLTFLTIMSTPTYGWRGPADDHCLGRLDSDPTTIFHCSICSHFTIEKIEHNLTPYVHKYHDIHIDPDCYHCGHIHDHPTCLPPPSHRPLIQTFAPTPAPLPSGPPPRRCRRYIFTPVYICWSCNGPGVDYITVGMFDGREDGTTEPSWDSKCQSCGIGVDGSWRVGWSVVMYERDDEGTLYMYDELPARYGESVVVEEVEVTGELVRMRQVPGVKAWREDAWEWRHFL